MNQQPIYDRIMSRNQANAAAANVEEPPRPKRGWLKKGLYSLLGAAIMFAGGYTGAHYDVVATFLSQPAVAETGQAKPAPEDTPFLQHAKQAGLKSCSTVFPALGELLTNGSQYSVQSFWNSETPDDHAVRALVGMNCQTSGYSGAAAGIVFAAPMNSDCEGSMIRVAPFATACTNIPAVLPQGSKLANNLGQVAVYSLGNGGEALLLPNGSSCIVISVASASKQANAQGR